MHSKLPEQIAIRQSFMESVLPEQSKVEGFTRGKPIIVSDQSEILRLLEFNQDRMESFGPVDIIFSDDSQVSFKSEDFQVTGMGYNPSQGKIKAWMGERLLRLQDERPDGSTPDAGEVIDTLIIKNSDHFPMKEYLLYRDRMRQMQIEDILMSDPPFASKDL